MKKILSGIAFILFGMACVMLCEITEYGMNDIFSFLGAAFPFIGLAFVVLGIIEKDK